MKEVSPELVGLTKAPGASPIEHNIATLLALILEVLIGVKESNDRLQGLLDSHSRRSAGHASAGIPSSADRRSHKVQLGRERAPTGEAIPTSTVLSSPGNQAAPRTKRTSK
jgi:hypothetical protein